MRPLAERDERVPQVDAEVDGQLRRLPPFGETAEGPERLLQVGDGLAVRPLPHGSEPRLAGIGDGLLLQLPAQGAMGQPLGLLGDALGGEPLDGLGDPRVEGALPVVKEPLVRHLVRECVLERVLRPRPGRTRWRAARRARIAARFTCLPAARSRPFGRPPRPAC
jgi:hypothetical protein